MIGDLENMRLRLRLALPDRWFADVAPVLDGLLLGLGSTWAGLHGLLGVVRAQSRRLTASGGFLDMTAGDLFGGRLPRHAAEADDVFRVRIGRALHRVRATRAAVLDAVAEEGGGAVRVFEPARPLDTGVYNGPGLGWGVAGGWGSLAMPLECLVIVQRSATPDAVVRAALAGRGRQAWWRCRAGLAATG